METRKICDLENYQDLANAIIVSTCKDYKQGKLSDKSFKEFCYGAWFGALTSVSPDVIYKGMKKEREKYVKKKNRNKHK